VNAAVAETPRVHVVSVASSAAEVRDIEVDRGVVWVASAAGVTAYDTRGRVLGTSRDGALRNVSTVGLAAGELTVGTAHGAFVWRDHWERVGPDRPVVAVTSRGEVPRIGGGGAAAVVYADRLDGAAIVGAATWRGLPVLATADARLHVGDRTLDLPGPAADLAVVGDELRVACMDAAFVLGDTERVLPVPATAAGAVWGTADGTLRDDAGHRIAAVPAPVTRIAALGDGWIVGTRDGVWRVAEDTRRLDAPDLCGNFVTGLTRWNGRRVAGTFDGGACVRTDAGWQPLAGLPSPMVNDVLAVGDSLWLATAEGLVRVRGDHVDVVGEVPDEAPRGAPGTNHPGVNALATDGAALWATDVLGPVRVGALPGDGRDAPWARYRFAVTGHSYQAIAACPGGAVWAGSEDDGLAVTGVPIGQRNGRSRWSQVGVFDGLPEDWIMAVACAGRQAAWVGTYRSGVGRVDASGWHPVPGLEHAWVQALAAAGDTLWVGTADGLYAVRAGLPTKVSDEDVWTLLVEGNTVWAGTRTGIVEYAIDG
jgi:ligand-binding sensor domain-containing protein